MRAMVLEAFGAPLRLQELPDPPPPGPGEVTVRVRACGLCHTDLKILGGRLPAPMLPELPHVLGHEAAGEVAATGARVTSVKEGDRVAVYFYLTCGQCRYCLAGEETLCDRVRQLGFNVRGAMAEYVVVPGRNVVPLAPGLPFEEAAIAGDAIATTLHGLRERGKIRPGERVLVLGAGGLGLHAVQVARRAGAWVGVVDVRQEKLDLARELGADAAGLFQEGETAEWIRSLVPGGVDLAVDFVAAPETLRVAAESLRKGGRLLLIGYRPEVPVAIPTMEVVLRNLSVVGSRAAPLRAFRETVELLGQGAIRPVVTDRFRLEEANQALERLRQGAVLGRAVLSVA